ncbi:hypothetical protein N180_02255 [Pedobacter antarcticus 4BY]|uniref:DUF2946 domain-containing protein n=2 Tax=Pedobacter antarcticus TaxID=34086 RepID=A0A081PCQ4_9SPHI|nr:hypothetical protein N180_02255 [Pedobacter antarcticus 4BY]
MVKRRREFMKQLISKAGCLLLVVLFLFISAAQILHTHGYKVQTEHATDNNSLDQSGDCKVCDYFIHHHGKQIFLNYPPLIAIPVPEIVVISSGVFARIYKFTLQGFTNKGPPAFN